MYTPSALIVQSGIAAGQAVTPPHAGDARARFRATKLA